MSLNHEEFFKISRQLERYHVLFYKLWELGGFQFSDEVPTACVRFDKVGRALQFIFNENFWKSLSETERAFIIAHECLHVILEHGKRGLTARNKDKANIAMDIVVNQILRDGFHFDVTGLEAITKGCWIETVFKEAKDIRRDGWFEYYYNLLKNNEENIQNQWKSFDVHSDLSDLDVEKLLGEMGSDITNEEKEKFREAVEGAAKKELKKLSGNRRGTKGGGFWHTVAVQNVVKKKKWETIIKQWSLKYKKEDAKTQEQWLRKNRRFEAIDSELLLPTEIEIDSYQKDKIEVWFFLDTSGSCIGYKDRFFKAAKSLPEDRFTIKAFSFDTLVYPVDLKTRKICGGGGTNFHILENRIRKDINGDEKKYPKAVFVISDGYGDYIRCAKPKNWYWFLTSNSTRMYIPKESNVYDLKDFE